MLERCHSALEGLEVLKDSEFLVALTWSVSTEQRLQETFV